MKTITFRLPPSAVGVLGLDDGELQRAMKLTLLPGKGWRFESDLYSAMIVLADLDERADAGSGFDETPESRGYARKGAASLRKQLRKLGAPVPEIGRALSMAKSLRAEENFHGR